MSKTRIGYLPKCNCQAMFFMIQSIRSIIHRLRWQTTHRGISTNHYKALRFRMSMRVLPNPDSRAGREKTQPDRGCSPCISSFGSNWQPGDFFFRFIAFLLCIHTSLPESLNASGAESHQFSIHAAYRPLFLDGVKSLLQSS